MENPEGRKDKTCCIMNGPAVTVLLPVYNGMPYLPAAIQSILEQDFNDLELLIIDDGSTDTSLEAINRFQDPRIRVLVNETNKGLIHTLNRGIGEANGKYIARMDGDDLSRHDRLRLQFDWLERSPTTAALASWVDFIDAQDQPAGTWKDDRRTVHDAQIRKALLRRNCIAHPSVMIRTDLLKRYGYDADQINMEDYDLWLRLVSDGHRIEKIPQPLLRYRIHPASVTKSKLGSQNVFTLLYRCKRKYLRKKSLNGRLNGYDRWLRLYSMADFIRSRLKEIKGSFLPTSSHHTNVAR